MSGRLQTLLSEYGDSLTRVDGEKDHQNALAKRAEAECQCSKKHFKKLALALHKDLMKTTRDDLGEQIDLFDQMLEAAP